MKRYLNQVRTVLQDSREKKGFLKILYEFAYLSLKKREIALYYGGKYLYRKEHANVKDYLSVGEAVKINNSPVLHPYAYTSILTDKLSFALYTASCGLPAPETVSYNLGNHFFKEGNLQRIESREEVVRFFQDRFDKLGEDKLFVKALDEKGGKGCYLFSKETLTADLDAIAVPFYEQAFIHQRLIKQHPEINAIYSSSINSLRFVSYIDKKGTPHILSALMRFGAGGSFVDNASAGGFYVAIDLEEGCLAKNGYQFMKGGGKLITQHPDTGFSFEGFKLPYFKEACDLILEAVAYIPSQWTGWDIAITTYGPLLIEGNEKPGMMTADIAYGGYRKHPLVREAFERVAQEQA